MHILKLFMAGVAILSLSACLSTDIERSLAGAAAGAVISDAMGGDVATGAVIGGAAGALCDDVTRFC